MVAYSLVMTREIDTNIQLKISKVCTFTYNRNKYYSNSYNAYHMTWHDLRRVASSIVCLALGTDQLRITPVVTRNWKCRLDRNSLDILVAGFGTDDNVTRQLLVVDCDATNLVSSAEKFVNAVITVFCFLFLFSLIVREKKIWVLPILKKYKFWILSVVHHVSYS